ncbi:MAG TPA: glycoside hydrolase domain-containing protein [Abditibacterium sp.]|jgi:hypothetical protein
MKFLVLALLMLISDAFAQDWKLTPVSSRQKLTALQNGVLEPFKPEPVQLQAARGEWESFQFVVTAGAQPIENLQITRNGLASIGGDFLASQSLQIFRENYVFVAQPSGNRVLTPKWWPDALIPLELAPKRIEANRSAVFWATIRVPADAAPGDYSGDYFGELDFLADGAPRRLAVSLTVQNVTLPKPTFRGTVAVYYDALRDWYLKNAGKTFTDAEWDIQKKRYYNFLLDYGLNAYDLPVAWSSPEAEIYLKNPRVHSVRTPPLDSPDFPLALEKVRATNTLSKAFYYWIDEPQTPEQFKNVRETTEKLRKLGVKHLVTAHPNAALKDAVDIWCPNIGDFFGIGHLDVKALQNERKRGRETWLYTMVVPKFPYPTWLLDDSMASIRAYAPLWASGGFTGFVYSMAHGWGPKPLENLQSFEGTNGDGTLLYPAEIVGGVGPMPSLRLMALRDAIEDYELNRVAAAPKIVTGRVATSGTTILQREGARQTRVSWRLDAPRQHLIVNFRAAGVQSGDYVAVELSPLDVEAKPEKWHFVATLKGNQIIEKSTREGRFRFESSDYRALVKSSAGSYSVEMQIPLSVLDGATKFRFDALRRTTVGAAKITIYAYSGSGDPARMPIFDAAQSNTSKTKPQPIKPPARGKI